MPTLNGTRRITMPQVPTRRREPITLLAKRGRLHLQTQKLALVVITQEAEAHSLISLGTVARYTTAPIASSLNLCGCSAKALHPSPSLLVIFCSHSSPAVRRDAETTAQPRPMDPSAHPPTNPHRPSVSSPPPPDIVSLLTPRRFPSRLRIRCSSPAPHLAPPCYPMHIYTSLDAKYVLFCVAYALVCAGRAVLYVHARRP